MKRELVGVIEVIEPVRPARVEVQGGARVRGDQQDCRHMGGDAQVGHHLGVTRPSLVLVQVLAQDEGFGLYGVVARTFFQLVLELIGRDRDRMRGRQCLDRILAAAKETEQ